MKTIKRLGILAPIIKRIENWPEHLLYRAGIFKGFYTVRFRDGMSLLMRSGAGDFFILNEVILSDSYLKRFPDIKGWTVVDVGAHIGTFSVLAASRGAKVFAYEPVHENMLVLEVNSDHGKLFKAFRKAVSDHEGIAHIFLSGHSFGHSLDLSDLPGFDFPPKGTEETPCTTIREIMKENQLERIDLLKLDCEGAEFPILHSLTDEEFRKIHRIVLEYHTGDRSKAGALVTFLASKYAQVEERWSGGPQGYLFCMLPYEEKRAKE